MQTANFIYNNKKYIVENNNGLINVFADGQEEAICNGFRNKLNTEWNNSKLAQTLYKIALQTI